MIIAEILSYPFLARALAVGFLISLTASLLGVSLVLRRFSMIGDGLSHVGFGALGIAAVLSLPPMAVTIPVVVAAAFLLPSADNVSNLLIGSNIGAFGTVISAPALIALHSMMKRGKKDSLIFTAYYTGASVLFIALSSLYINLI